MIPMIEMICQYMRVGIVNFFSNSVFFLSFIYSSSNTKSFFRKIYIPHAFYFTIGFPRLISHIIVDCSNVMKIRRHSRTVYIRHNIRTRVVLFIVIVFALKVIHGGYRFFTVFSIDTLCNLFGKQYLL